MDDLKSEIAAWTQERNYETVRINWRFTTPDARIRLKALCPSIEHGYPNSLWLSSRNLDRPHELTWGDFEKSS
jgi:hypothetical protein